MDEKDKQLKIYLVYLNGTAYVFNDKDYMKLRTEYRIVGKFIGTSNSRGFTANNNSIPAELTKFETQLLLEKGIAILLNKSSLAVAPNAKESKEVSDLYEQRINDQEHSFINCKIEQSKSNMAKILFGRKKKLERCGISEVDNKISEEKILTEIRSGIKFENHNALLDISCEHLHKHDAVLLNELSLQCNSFKYCIFKDIWERGYYITSGEAFGADFIAYPGDPLIYHACYIILVENNTRMNINNMVAKCRLSITVNKTFICAYQNHSGEILYQTIHWEGQRGNNGS